MKNKKILVVFFLILIIGLSIKFSFLGTSSANELEDYTNKDFVPKAETLSEEQQAIRNEAYAFYYRGAALQYDDYNDFGAVMPFF